MVLTWHPPPFSPERCAVQDSVGAMSTVPTSCYTGFHKMGMDWSPNEYIRWYGYGSLRALDCRLLC